MAGAIVPTAYALATAQHPQEAADVLLRGAGGPQLPRIRVAELISRGYADDGAARTLHVSRKTIEKHPGDIYRRLAIDYRKRSRCPVAGGAGDSRIRHSPTTADTAHLSFCLRD